MIKLSDIARELNLNVSVISRALNPQPDKHAIVKQETRELILQTARRMGYRPNRYASYLKRGKMPTILCFLPDRPDRLIADLILGISERAAIEGFPVNFCVGGDLSKFIDFLKDPSKIGHCGIISYPPDKITDPNLPELLKNYLENGGKALLLNSYIPIPDGLSAIVQLNIDDEAGARLAADHLLQRQCARIYTVTEDNWCQTRLRAFRTRIEQSGMPCGTIHLPDLSELAHRRNDNAPIGLFAEHDFCALNLIGLLKEQGIPPGAQVKVVGYDGQLFTDDRCLGLTTLHQPTREEGRLAVRKLVNIINGAVEKNEQLVPQLIVRRSSGGNT